MIVTTTHKNVDCPLCYINNAEGLFTLDDGTILCMYCLRQLCADKPTTENATVVAVLYVES